MNLNVTYFHKSVKLNEDQIYDAGNECPICGNSQRKMTRFTVQEKPAITLLQCQRCYGLSASHMPKIEALDEFYAGFYDNISDNNITFQDPARFAKHIQRIIPDIFSAHDPVNILDYGGGNGALSLEIARQLQPRKVHITVVDYQEAGHTVTEGITIEKKDSLKGLARLYDIVLASAVIEHIPEPGEIITDIFSVLKDGGYFYARTPWVSPLMKIAKIDFCYPGHVHDLGPAFWNRLAETFDLDADIITSMPSIVQTIFSKAFLRTLMVYLLKLPACIQCKFARKPIEPFWKFVGGWEILLKKNIGK